MIALLASFMIATNAPAAELVASCRTMIPADVQLDGRIILRNRKGFAQAEYYYTLVRSGGETGLELRDGDGNPVVYEFSAHGHFQDLESVDGAYRDIAQKFSKLKAK